MLMYVLLDTQQGVVCRFIALGLIENRNQVSLEHVENVANRLDCVMNAFVGRPED